jgi:hypothetical protein
MVANPARLTNGSGRPLHSSAVVQADGVYRTRFWHTWSHRSHESNPAAHRSSCGPSTCAGSSTMLARIRASWTPESHSPAASSWSRPSSFASARSSATVTPIAVPPPMPERAMPPRRAGSASPCSRASVSSMPGTTG